MIGTRLDGSPLVVMLDVDGTLAPIAPRPEDARVPPETRAVISRLAGLEAVHVVVVSGRSAADARALVGIPEAWTIGNHGLELIAPDGHTEADPAAARFEPALERVAAELEALARDVPGAQLEHKRWTMSLHYRMADEARVPALLVAAHARAMEAGLRVTEGKKVMEVRPPVDVHKGTASVRLAERLGAFGSEGRCFFAGDDRTDEDAMSALRARDPRTVTVRVGDGDTVAEFRVHDPDALRELLRAIADRRSR